MRDEMEEMLLRYRPVGAAAGLRERVMGAAVERTGRVRWGVWVWRGAVAAGLVVAWGLMLAADGIGRETAAVVGRGAPKWTEEAEEAAKLINAGEAGRRYVAVCLAGERRGFRDEGGVR